MSSDSSFSSLTIDPHRVSLSSCFEGDLDPSQIDLFEYEDSDSPPSSAPSSPPTRSLKYLHSKHYDLEPEQSPFTAQEDYLSFLEPTPVLPPHFSDICFSPSLRFPVTEHLQAVDILPPYSASAYKVGLVNRKLEWLSPYEPSPSRSWKTLVIELNSTQLNFYLIPSEQETAIFSFSPKWGSEYLQFDRREGMLSNYHSLVTTESDCQFMRHLATKLHKLRSENSVPNQTFDFPKLKLVRSYSLQHARLGVASDYAKKPNVLRLRLESEQFLLSFNSSREMIEWNLGLSVGRDVALDILDRECPRYRTVPRRRRNQGNSSSIYYQDAVIRRFRTTSDASIEKLGASLKLKLTKFKAKLSSSKSSMQLSSINLRLPNFDSSFSLLSSSFESAIIMEAPAPTPVTQKISRSKNNSSASFTICDDDGEESDNISEFIRSEFDSDIADEDDMVNMLRDDSRSEDEGDELLVPNEEEDAGFQTSNSAVLSSGNTKWNPIDSRDSPRKVMRNCLKCIKPLPFDEAWLNKPLTKPTTVSPLCLVYLRRLHYASGSHDLVVHSSMEACSQVSNCVDVLSESSKRKLPAIFGTSSSSLARVPNHNVREYFVGTHSLVPKDLVTM